MIQSYDPVTKLAIGSLDGDRIHVGVGGTVGIDAGYEAYFTNAYVTLQGRTQVGAFGPDPDLKTFTVAIGGASEFDTLTAGASAKVSFSDGLDAGSEVRYIRGGSNYLLGTVSSSSTASKLVVDLVENVPVYLVGSIIGGVNYSNTSEDPAHFAERDILVSVKTGAGLEIGGTSKLTVSTGRPIKFYDSGDELMVGSNGNDVFNYLARNVAGSNNDSIDGLGGYDVLNLGMNGYAEFTQIRGIEQINGTNGHNNFSLDAEAFESLQFIDLKKGHDAFHIVGNEIDLQNVRLRGVEEINVSPLNREDQAIVKVDDYKLAKLVWSLSPEYHTTLVMTKGSLTSAQRAELYGHHFESIVTPEGRTFRDVIGNDKRNVLAGTSGDNVLSGGGGNDTLRGKGGRDVFIFDERPRKGNVDKIKDFNARQDTIEIVRDMERGIFSKITKAGKLSKSAFHIGAEAHDKSDRIIYNEKSGAIYYDRDGSGSGDAVKVAVLANKPQNLKHHDFFIV